MLVVRSALRSVLVEEMWSRALWTSDGTELMLLLLSLALLLFPTCIMKVFRSKTACVFSGNPATAFLLLDWVNPYHFPIIWVVTNSVPCVKWSNSMNVFASMHITLAKKKIVQIWPEISLQRNLRYL